MIRSILLFLLYLCALPILGVNHKNSDENTVYYFKEPKNDNYRIAFNIVDPHSSNSPTTSPYSYCDGDPINNIDPTGMDYWSTNDITLITAFFNALINGELYHDFSGWKHVDDNQFCQSIIYNDETKTFYATITEIINGELNVICTSYDANIKPGLTSHGEGYVGAFAYEGPYDIFWYGSHFLYGNSYPDVFREWKVDLTGRITGIKPVIGMPPIVGKARMGRGIRNMSANRNIQKEQINYLAKRHKLSKDEREILHRYISHEGYGFHEIEQAIFDLFGK